MMTLEEKLEQLLKNFSTVDQQSYCSGTVGDFDECDICGKLWTGNPIWYEIIDENICNECIENLKVADVLEMLNHYFKRS